MRSVFLTILKPRHEILEDFHINVMKQFREISQTLQFLVNFVIRELIFKLILYYQILS